MQLHEAIYYYILRPKEAIKKSITFEYSFFVYLLAALSISISAIYVIDNKSNILNLFIFTFGIAAYMAISNIIKIAVINLTVSLFFKTDNNNTKTFINNCFGIFGIFVFILPITLLFSRFKSLYFIQVIMFFILGLYYMVLMFNNIKHSFNIDSSFKAFLVLIAPIVCDYLTYISLGILIFGTIISYI
ncbi:hypothetical protein SZ47_12555 [Brachyspira hyodysenteriae]|uniref:Yip1 domain-containing protein n=1 Tax=Brachyspira hyodysenteriae ATCC 27164 TaxID=1266923 RepID=A0A3B6VUR6_BRAHO|nr:hypothetical protein [Brachyspira hyodysenteriae]ANN64586.1 hypothetical protein BHYOB78_12150 [Brachyspira hyodysenteriae ATCC 27164]KLI22804.1 hypothetical protein SZ47_12555 [Brachyspira hyodysenteriae]MCZ9924255.1 hypothetical protein [Brachyspira hyodysenteriae]TVL65690.1 hypothetical protein A9X74_01450 [Brachyspira hyodysenteriae]TVL79550.1 hypothetical protein A9X80_02165 [Brachyspira hyodysenteriae]